jgi:manganese efflux pump family protein
MMGRLLAFVLPLGLDSFAVATAIGAAGPATARQRWRIALLFLGFEAGMPLIGVGLGAPLARAIGSTADYLAAAAVVAVGGWMLLADDDREEEHAQRLGGTHGVALLALGISISLDELAIGFGLGLVHLPVVPVVIALGTQAFVAVQLGLRLGARVAERHREIAERLAGLALVGLGIYLAVQQALT